MFNRIRPRLAPPHSRYENHTTKAVMFASSARTALAPIVATLVAGLVFTPLSAAFAAAPPPAAPAADDSPAVWSVQASSSKGPDGRDALAYSVGPGTEIKDFIAVSNSGKSTQSFQLYATDATNDLETGAFSLLAHSTKASDSGSWIKVSESSITLEPGHQARIPFTMLVPSDASPGDHTSGIVASVIKASTSKTGQVITLEQRVGARVYLRVAGATSAKISTSGFVAGFNPSLNPFSGGDASVNYSITNSGNSRVDVKQAVTITGPFGIPLASFAAPRIRNLLPGQSVHQNFSRPGIPPLLLLWSQVTLTPDAPTDRVAQSKLRAADGSPAAPSAAPSYRSISAESTTGAVSFTLLGLIVVLALAFWVLTRYLSYTRDQLYDAIDAAAQAGRESAIAESTAHTGTASDSENIAAEAGVSPR